MTRWMWFGAWVLVGAVAALGLISVIGVFVLPPVAVIAIFMATRPQIRQSAFGAVSGAGLLLLAIAYIQRDGPGTTCTQVPGGIRCDQHLNPIPWLVLGVLFLIAGVVGQVRANPRSA